MTRRRRSFRRTFPSPGCSNWVSLTIYNCKVQDLVTTASGLPESMRDAWIKK